MKATSKLRLPHPSTERPLQGLRGSFYLLIARMPTLHLQMFHISSVLRCFRKCAKMRTFERERVKGCFNFETSGNHQKTDLKANAYIQNHGNTLNTHSTYMYMYMYMHIYIHPHAHVHTYKSIGNTQRRVS